MVADAVPCRRWVLLLPQDLHALDTLIVDDPDFGWSLVWSLAWSLVSLGLHCFLRLSSAGLIVVLAPGCCGAYSAFSV